jgi:hypothetical protein
MNKRQRWIVANFAGVIVITVASVIGMVELKNRVNHSEATRAMEHLWRVVSDYKQKNGSIPPQSYIDGVKEVLEGKARIGNLQYRALGIQVDSPPDTILAYVIKEYHSLFFRPEAIVLRLNGRVEWMDKQQFEQLLSSQQTPLELQLSPAK